jgi:heterotetrameric sarcosine oxidase gamma subunit
MADRISPVSQSKPVAGLSHRACAVLLQYHAWPVRYAEMERNLAAHCGLPEAPRPGKAVRGASAALLRVHPQRLWLVAEKGGAQDHPRLSAEMGAALDLSHARTIIHIDDGIAVPLLSRFIAIDLRPDRFALDDVALTPFHRVSVVLWRRADGIDILAPRSFARSIWEVLVEAAA